MMQTEARRKQKYSSLRTNLHARTGFTLMELLIVLALLIIVLGMVYSFFYFINKSSVRSGDQFQLQTNLRNAGDFAAEELRNAKEIEIVTIPFITNPSSQYLYVKDKVLKHQSDGTITDKSENVITDETVFMIRKDNMTNRYYISINLHGERRDEKYTYNVEILLNNISSITGPLSGNAIRYMK